MHSVKSEGRKGRRVRRHHGFRCALAAMMIGFGSAHARAQRIEEQKLTASRAAAALPSLGVEIPFTERVISTSADSAQSVFAADVDGDGDIDILSASRFDDKIAWYESDGGSPPTFTERVISTTADSARSVFAVDLDGDGDIDVLSASDLDDKIAWYESDGGSPPTFTERPISTAADGALSVFATDVDGDGDTDVLSASTFDDKIAWYENDGGSPPTFAERVISTAANGAISVFAADVDGDGDTDVLSASFFDDEITWYDSDGGSPPTFTRRLISTTADGAVSVFATDLDGDGDTDVLSASFRDNKIAWYDSDGGSPPTFTERVISTGADGPQSVFAIDVGGDGVIDVISASFGDGKIAWYESDGGLPPSFTERLISTTAQGAGSVFATDVDGDGDTDILSASTIDDTIAWYENTMPPCGNGTLDEEEGEECDRGLGCTDCACDPGFVPTVPLSFDCVSTCANDSLDPGEECDGGLACTDCLCDGGFESTVPPSVDCRAICSNGSLDPGEECEGGLACTDCVCDLGFESTVPLSGDCRSICSNGRLDPGEECDGGVGCTDCLCEPGSQPTVPLSFHCRSRCPQGCGECSREQKLTASDAAEFDLFGLSVSVSGDIAVVGAERDECDSFFGPVPCGSAYVYRLNGNTWVEEQKLTASDEREGADFGGAVSVSGDTILVGARGAAPCGAAYVFRFNGISWIEEQKLLASDGVICDGFGISVSVSGDTALVGAPRHGFPSCFECGAAYMFRFNGISWDEEQKLIESGGWRFRRDHFGVSVSVSGNTAVVGTPGDDCAAGLDCGAAWIFRFIGTSWFGTRRLTAFDAAASDRFGSSVAVSGDRAVVGAPGDDCLAPGQDCGSAYTFRFSGTTWRSDQKLTTSDAEASDGFGSSVSVSGNTALVGATADECAAGDRCGSAYVFRSNGTSWVEEEKLTPVVAESFDQFGVSVSVSGETSIVGAFQDRCDEGHGRCGAAYMFWCVPPPTPVNLDIKPDSCPNPVNPKSKGVVPVAILGSVDFDVATIDSDSLTLARADGVGESVSPVRKRNGPKIAIEDVATAFADEGCVCREQGPDGIDDLSLKFSTVEMTRALKLDGSSRGESIELVLRGTLHDGTAFEGTDCIVIPGSPRTSGELRRATRSK